MIIRTRGYVIKARQAVIDRLFPDGDQPGQHKFRADTGACAQCGLHFTKWCTKKPDGTYQAGPKLCPVIGKDELRDSTQGVIRGDDGGY